MQRLFPTYTIGHFINQPGNRTEFELMRFEMLMPGAMWRWELFSGNGSD